MELVEAFDVLPPAVHNQGSMMAFDQMLAETRHRSERYLSEVQGRLQTAGHLVTWATFPGSPGRAIVDRASADADALVVMSTHGRGGLARWALSSVTDRVLHSVPKIPYSSYEWRLRSLPLQSLRPCWRLWMVRIWRRCPWTTLSIWP